MNAEREQPEPIREPERAVSGPDPVRARSEPEPVRERGPVCETEAARGTEAARDTASPRARRDQPEPVRDQPDQPDQPDSVRDQPDQPDPTPDRPHQPDPTRDQPHQPDSGPARPDQPEPVPGEPDSARAERLRMLVALDTGSGHRDVLRSALLHATSELGGLGGMAHLRGPGIGDRGLGLIVSSGLPPAFTRNWDRLSENGPAPPARAAQDGGAAWLSPVAGPGAGPPPSRTGGDPPRSDEADGAGPASPATAALPDSGVPADAGIAAVALPGPDGPLGALSVVTRGSGEPDSAQWAFLRDVAEWAAGRLTPPVPDTVSPLLRPPEPEEPPEPVEALRQALGDEPVWDWEWDLRTGALSFDAALLDALGIDRAEFRWTAESWAELVHPDDRPWALAEAERAIRARDTMDNEQRVRRSDGTYVWERTRGEVVTDTSGRPVRVLGHLWITTDKHAASDSVSRALRHMSDGFLAVGGDWRIGFVNVAAEALFGSSPDLVGRSLWDVPAVRGLPNLEARCRQAVAEGAPNEFDMSWPDTDRWYHLRLVPVPDGLTLYITDITGQRVREAERRAADRAAGVRAALVDRLTRALAEAGSAQDVVTAVSDSVLPPLGATALVVMALENNRLQVVGQVGFPAGYRDRVNGRPVLAAGPVGDALHTRTPLFLESMHELTGRYSGAAALPTAEGMHAWAVLPLIASGRGIGVCVVAFDYPRRLTDDERTLLTAFSGLVAQALERARLFDAARTAAQELQRMLLPRTLPLLPAVTTAARFLPAGPGAQVGGDWYDVIPLSADRVALVIGDVMGHGMAEAATMGRLRTAVRTLSGLELPPDDILGHLNDIVSDLGDDYFATCLYGIYDPVTSDFTIANAGHPPPATVGPDGVVCYPEVAVNPPLGAAAPPFDITRTKLADGSLVVLYTDGLVESTDRGIDAGMARLARVLAAARRETDGERLEPLCDRVTEALLPELAGDDAALLIARPHALPPGAVASWPLPEEPVAAGQARDHVREQLAAWRLDDELTMTTELLASELVGNVVRHAKGPLRLRLLRSRTLICEVSDGSLTTPHIRHSSATDEGGRGLQLVAALAQRWGTRYTADGKSIWTEQPIPRPDAASPDPARPDTPQVRTDSTRPDPAP